MAVPIDHALKVLESEFKTMTKLFPTDDWKKFKFGLGGPHKRILTKLQRLSNEMDSVIAENFGTHDDNASFGKLIALCLRNDNTYKELYKHVSVFRRQLKRMKRQF
jgi:hypothetical protein